MNEPIWLSVFRVLMGLEEFRGVPSNPVILRWAKDINAAPSWYNSDEKSWCALALNRVLMACQLPMARTTPLEPQGYDLLRAKTFESYGQSLAIPALGCIMTFTRPEGNHVGIYLGERKDAYSILGANQSDIVDIAWVSKNRLTSIRWPNGVPLPTTGRIWLDGSAT